MLSSLAIAWAQCATAQTADCNPDVDPGCPTPLSRSLDAIEAYVIAPLHWGGAEWLQVGGSLAAIGVAYHFDSEVRTHFVGHSAAGLSSAHLDDVPDALPSAAVLIGTWGYAHFSDDDSGLREADAMLEASAFTLGVTYAAKYAAGRLAPYQTTDPGRWGTGGASFPSEHAALAFAIGVVLAESGNDRYRWIRRILGYGVAGFTAYERLDHNAHWLSDVVAGAALGTASARFAMHRSEHSQTFAFGFAPVRRGIQVRVEAHL